MKKWYIEIVEFESGEVVKRFECDTERQADRFDSAANINLNHDKFYTRVVEDQDQPLDKDA